MFLLEFNLINASFYSFIRRENIEKQVLNEVNHCGENLKDKNQNTDDLHFLRAIVSDLLVAY